MPADPHGAAGDRPDALLAGPASATSGWFGQERGEVGADGDRSDAGAAAAVGDAEGLVQVQVADVGAEPPGPGQPDEGVEVGAVDVDLPAGVVDRARTGRRCPPRTRRGSRGR